jgi:hypothetical protein
MRRFCPLPQERVKTKADKDLMLGGAICELIGRRR